MPVGPLCLQGAVEAFDFAVLPGAVRSDELVLRSDGSDELGESGGVLVAPVVVGRYPFDRDSVVGVEVDRMLEERGAGLALLVIVDLGVREAAVVVDDQWM